MNSMPSSSHIVNLTVIREAGVTPMSDRKREVCWDFGIPPRESPQTIVDGLKIDLGPGQIVLVGGPSGSGKSSVLHAIDEEVGAAIWVSAARFPSNRSVVDCIAVGAPMARVLEVLTACGLGEPRLWVRRFQDLSDGERFRASLARAIGLAIRTDASPVILCDEFTAILHRRIAKSIAFNLRKLVTRHRLRLVVATTSEDISMDLQPDQVVRLGGASTEVMRSAPRKRAMSLRRRVQVVPGSVSDYRVFGPMHYRHRDSLGFVDKVFLLKESSSRDAVGILVVAHAPLELYLRNRVTDGRFIRNVRRLNKELRIVRRLVMHPDVRGCGLGHHFVRESLPRVGVRFVEALAAMGTVNPVFEKAGMQRVGQCPQPKGRIRLLERLAQWGIDPFGPDFAEKISRRPRVRKLVEDTIEDWATSLHTPLKYKPESRTPSLLASMFRQVMGRPPMYYLWDREGEFPRGSKAPGRHRGNSDRAERERDGLRSTSGKEKLRPTRGAMDGADPAKRRRR